MVFSDKSLQAMATAKPLNLSAFEDIPGVGQAKLDEYGTTFIDLIRSHVTTAEGPKNLKGKTYMVTLNHFKDGLTPEEIAVERNLSETTVYSHLAQLYSDGEDIDLNKFIDKNLKSTIISFWKELGKPNELKAVYLGLEEKVPYHQIRIALTLHKKEDLS